MTEPRMVKKLKPSKCKEDAGPNSRRFGGVCNVPDALWDYVLQLCPDIR
jgi:hypothetical protein